MKCNACYSENVNTAQYCKKCGRNIADTYHTSAKSSLLGSIIILLCASIVVAAAIVGSGKIKALFAKRTISQFYVMDDSSIDMTYMADDNKTCFVHFNNDQKVVTTLKKGHYSVVESNGSSIIAFCDGQYYCIQNSKITELKNCISWQIGKSGLSCAYLDDKLNLYYVVGGCAELLAENVEQYKIKDDGSMVCYKSGNEVHLADKIINMLCCVDNEFMCNEILAVSSSNIVFYSQINDTLIAIPCVKGDASSDSADTERKKYSVGDFEQLISVNDNKALITKKDGSTCVVTVSEDEDDIEKVLYKKHIDSILLPDGYQYKGDYTDCMYMIESEDESASIVKISNNSSSVKTLCEDYKLAKPSGDNGYLYYTDENDDLYRVDAKGVSKTVKCGENVARFVVSSNCQTVYYLTYTGDLYKFDGYLYKEIAKDRNFISIELDTNNDFIILKSGTIKKNGKLNIEAMFSYKNKLNVVAENFDEEIKHFGRIGGSFYYLDKENEIFLSDENGQFNNVNDETDSSVTE